MKRNSSNVCRHARKRRKGKCRRSRRGMRSAWHCSVRCSSCGNSKWRNCRRTRTLSPRNITVPNGYSAQYTVRACCHCILQRRAPRCMNEHMHPLDGAARLARRAAVLLIFISAPLVACAQDRFSFLNAVNTRFGVLQQSWYAIISIYAQRLFWGLAAIDFGWTALTLILDQNDLLEFFGVLVRKIITLGFFFGLLKMAGVWIPDIIDSFRRIGAAAGAVPATTTPDGVVNEGYELALG